MRRPQGAQEERIHEGQKRSRLATTRSIDCRLHDGFGQRRPQHQVCITQGIEQGPRQFQFHSARNEHLPESIGRPEVAQETVDVDQIAQPMRQFPFLKKVRGAVQEPILWHQDHDPAAELVEFIEIIDCHRACRRQQFFGARLPACR